MTLVVLQADIVLLGSFQIPPSEKPIPFEHEITVGAYYYTWYGGPRHWWEGYTNTPVLGRYSSWDSSAADWHIKWAVDNGIDFFAVSWLGSHSWEEDALKHGLLQSQYLDYIRFCICYESVIRMQAIQTQNAQCNATFKSDVQYITNEFFNHPQYLKLDGKPVLILYYVTYLHQRLRLDGDPANAIRKVRQELLDMGFDVYLVADMTGFPVLGTFQYVAVALLV